MLVLAVGATQEVTTAAQEADAALVVTLAPAAPQGTGAPSLPQETSGEDTQMPTAPGATQMLTAAGSSTARPPDVEGRVLLPALQACFPHKRQHYIWNQYQCLDTEVLTHSIQTQTCFFS